MDIKEIKAKINKNSPVPLGVNEFYSVLLPLFENSGELQIVFQVRAEELSTQPGEISLPGGKIEDNEHRAQTALRETREELSLSGDKVELFGELDFLVTPYNLIIYSFCGRLQINSLDDIDYNTGEVKDIFAVPLRYFKDNPPDCYKLKIKKVPVDEFPYQLIPGGKNYNWREGFFPVYFYKYQGHIIWGFTAKIIKSFIGLL